MSQFTILAVSIAIVMTLLFLYSDNKIFSDNVNYVAEYLSKLIIFSLVYMINQFMCIGISLV